MGAGGTKLAADEAVLEQLTDPGAVFGIGRPCPDSARRARIESVIIGAPRHTPQSLLIDDGYSHTSTQP